MKKWIECNKKASIQKSVISKECFKERVKHEKGATEKECNMKKLQYDQSETHQKSKIWIECKKKKINIKGVQPEKRATSKNAM